MPQPEDKPPPLEQQYADLIAFVWDCEAEQDFQRRIDSAAAEAERQETKKPPES